MMRFPSSLKRVGERRRTGGGHIFVRIDVKLSPGTIMPSDTSGVVKRILDGCVARLTGRVVPLIVLVT
jgi:hypothetical protein